jgi:hypothetical protein
LRQESDTAPQLKRPIPTQPRHVSSVDENLAPLWRDEGAEEPKKKRLPRGRGPEKHHVLPAIDVKVDIF